MMQVPTLHPTTPWTAGARSRDSALVPGVRRALFALLAGALVLRLALVWAADGTGLQIVDEQHYATLARNVADGNGFAWGAGQPTSIRPPLYPFFVATVWRLTGTDDPGAIRFAHIPLALVSIWLVFLIGRRAYNAHVGLLAAAVFAFYPSLLFSGVLVLSETLFTLLLLGAMLGCLRLIDRPSLAAAFLTGLCIGAAALTRSVMYPFIGVLVLAMLGGMRWPWRTRLTLAAVLVAGYAVVVGPWAIRNTRLQGTVTLVDTMGGLNLMMGNYAYTPEDRMWDAVSLTGNEAWYRDLPARAPDGRAWTEGTKDKWAQRQAIAYITAHPMTFVRRAALKFADFWGIERDFIAGVQKQLYHPPTWLFVLVAAATVGTYAATLLLGVTGLCLARPSEWRVHALFAGTLLFVCGLHAITFGHARYHLPLVPLLLVYGAAAIDQRAWRGRWRAAAGLAAASLVVVVGAIWAREVFVRDAGKLAELARLIGLSR
jgi:4-amino-4-deoxy-L-arabinose transferase-like glycosyltransferase